MEQAKSIVPRLFQQEQRSRRALDLVRAYWPDAVGTLLSKHSIPVALEPPTLVVEARDQAWMELLLPMRAQVTALLKELLPKTGILEIEVRLAPPEPETIPEP